MTDFSSKSNSVQLNNSTNDSNSKNNGTYDNVNNNEGQRFIGKKLSTRRPISRRYFLLLSRKKGHRMIKSKYVYCIENIRKIRIQKRLRGRYND